MNHVCSFGGPKICKGHTTFTRLARLISEIAQRHERVKRVSPGRIEPHRSKQPHVEVHQMSGAILFRVNDGCARQDIIVYTSNILATIQDIIFTAQEKGIEMLYLP